MSISSIIVDEGRDQLISYFRNSSATTQTSKLYFKEFHLLTGITGTAITNKVWDGTEEGNDISGHLISGATFDISNRTQESGRKLRLHLVVPSNFDSGDSNIDGVAIRLQNESGEKYLLGYATFSGFNKVAGTDLTIYFDIHF
jgi:hypothetical protein